MNIINDLNVNKLAGYDNISCFFIKLSSPLLTLILSSLASANFKLGIFSDNLKIAKVVPLYKAGNKSDFNSYRPIFL